MGVVPDERTMLSAAEPLVRAGVAVHWLFRRTKKPAGPKGDGADWQTADIHTMESLKASYRSGYNIGVRPGEFSKTAAGYLHLIDLDIREPGQADAAWALILKKWPDARAAPYVISGSGGESRHLYLFTDKPFRSQNLGHSEGFTMVWDATKGREVKKYDWEVSFFGAPKQAVLPPSIHPDTGEPYTWGREIDWDLLLLDMGPIIPSETIESWGIGARIEDDDEDDLMTLVRMSPMGLTIEEVKSAVAGLPPAWVDDRDQWREVGMALSHEFEGGQQGFDIWTEWSRSSPKYDAKDQVDKWKSFKGSRKPVRMATLIKAAAIHRLEMDHDTLDLLADEDDELDLLADQPGTALTIVQTEGAEDELDPLADGVDTTDAIVQSFAPGAIGPIDPEWRSYFQITDKGETKVCLHNIELIVRNDTRFHGIVGFNEFTKGVMLIKEPGTFRLKKPGPKPIRQLDGSLWKIADPVNGRLWVDSHDYHMRLLFETPPRQGGYGLKVPDRDLRAAVDIVAQKNAYHPVRNYLSSVKWDGKHRVARLWIDYMGSPDNAYHREAAQMFMLGAVTRAFEPGHKFDFVPILEGVQGKQKSTFVRTLARSWFSELEGDFHDNKAMVEKMQGSWIIEIPELQGFSKADVTTIKGFVSRQSDKVRMSYAHRADEYPRQCVFMGSTNDREYLRDTTGGRRFWPIACMGSHQINVARLEREVDQLWAEAKAMYDEMRRDQPRGQLPLYIRSEEGALEAAALQESRRQESVEESLAGRIEDWLDKPIGSEMGFDDLDETVPPVYRNAVSMIEIWVDMMGRDANNYDQRNQQLLGRAIRLVKGWDLAGLQKTEKYGRQRVFRRVESL